MSLLGRRTAIAVFLAFAFGYFISTLLRAITATLSPTLTAQFALHARDLGLLAGGYFLGFAAVQLPMGGWLDRHGPKRVILSLLVLAVAGCAAFAMAGSFAGLLTARVLCGIGLGAGMMAPLTSFRRWLTPAAQLRANAWMLMTGSFGMLASTLPVQWLLPLTGWRSLFWGLGGCVAIAMVAIALAVPAWPVHDPARSGHTGSYADVWKHPYFRRMAPIGFFNYGGMIAIQTLWAGPWMVRVAGYAPLESAAGLFLINALMFCAFLGWGVVTPWLSRRGITTTKLIAKGLPLSFVVLALVIMAGELAGALAWAAFCVSSTIVALAQPAVGMVFPSVLAGRALSAYNLVIFAGVFVVQWGIGLAIDGFQAAGLAEVTAFRAAMAAFLACNVLSYCYFRLAKDNSGQ